MGQVITTANCVFCGRLIKNGDLCKRHIGTFQKWTRFMRAELDKEKSRQIGSQPDTPIIA